MEQQKETLDFIVVGAQKSGTTSLYNYLRPHPEICLPAGKEAPYFSHDEVVDTTSWTTYMQNLVERDFASGADPEHKWGTVTPQYMYGSVIQANGGSGSSHAYDERTVPARIFERLPEVRLIAILRDPVERAISHHRMMVSWGSERRSFDDAVEQLLRPQAYETAVSRPSATSAYITWGEYGRILGGYVDVFPRDQLLVVFTEELERAPVGVLRSIQEFIGVSADFEPHNIGRKFHVGVSVDTFSWTSPSSWRSPLSPISPQGIARALRHSGVARAAWHAIPESSQRRLNRNYKRAATRTLQRSVHSADADPNPDALPSDRTLERLREHYAREADQLAALLGRAVPW